MLRVRHFHYQPFPEVQFGWPEPQAIVNEFQPDPELLWVTKDYAERLRLAAANHPAVIFIGDSCVEFSHYPGLVMEALARTAPSLATGTKLSVPGWSSEQGRAQLSRDVLALKPRVLIVEYGWNDHWDAMGPPDSDTHPSRVELWAAQHFRVVQAWLKARDGVRAHRDPEPGRRVPLARYRENLVEIVRASTAAGIKVILVTAPTSHAVGPGARLSVSTASEAPGRPGARSTASVRGGDTRSRHNGWSPPVRCREGCRRRRAGAAGVVQT